MDKIHATQESNMLADIVNPSCGLALLVGGDEILVTVDVFRQISPEDAVLMDHVLCRECVEITSI
jgi:hypothetical protein